ncbi:hypothetical protein D3C71_682610 [compost metagenome]
MQAIGQSGQRVVHGLVSQSLLGAQAFADLAQQLFVDLAQFAGALFHPFFQLGMRRAQALLVALARKTGADVLCDENQQALVMHTEGDLLGVALHHDRTDHFVVAQQRHTEPALRTCAGFAHLAGFQQRIDLCTRGQQGAPMTNHIFGQAATERARCTTRVVLVYRIDEIQPIALGIDQRDVEVACIQQAPDHAVDLPVELRQAVGRHRHFGDVVQRGLQLLGTAALGHFILQAQIGALQLLRAPFHLLLQPHLRLATIHGGLHVLGDKTQQCPFGFAVAVGVLVTLHHDRTAHAAIAQHRHAQPVQAFRAALRVVLLVYPRQQFARRSAQRPAMPQQRHGQAARHLVDVVALGRIGNEVIDLVGEVQEADLPADIVILDDVAVLRIHQRAQYAMHVAQHLAHFQVGTGQVGNLEQGLLQPFGLFQRLDLTRLAVALQGQFHRLPGQPPPGRRGCRPAHRQQQPGAVVLPAVAAFGRVGQRLPDVLAAATDRPTALPAAELRIVPTDAHDRRFRQQRMQRAHQRRAQHRLVV